jgi:hypothetical protein
MCNSVITDFSYDLEAANKSNNANGVSVSETRYSINYFLFTCSIAPLGPGLWFSVLFYRR